MFGRNCDMHGYQLLPFRTRLFIDRRYWMANNMYIGRLFYFNFSFFVYSRHEIGPVSCHGFLINVIFIMPSKCAVGPTQNLNLLKKYWVMDNSICRCDTSDKTLSDTSIQGCCFWYKRNWWNYNHRSKEHILCGKSLTLLSVTVVNHRFRSCNFSLMPPRTML